MNDKERIVKLFQTLEKVREKKLGEDWQLRIQLTNLEEKILEEIKRVIKVNGVIVIGVPGTKGFQSDPDHKCFYDQEALIKLAKESGFSIKEFFYTPFFKSSFLSNILRQYCIYCVWQKI